MNCIKKATFFSLIVLAMVVAQGSRITAQDSGPFVQSTAENPIKEIGSVKWLRDFDSAQEISSKSGKPVFLLFQEIPGCQGCQDYGEQVLSHPLLVEAIEDLFVPVLVYNNRKGADEKMLQRFDEPSWNYPVARYLDHQGQDLIIRKDKIWEIGGTVTRMIAALEKADREVPSYLQMISAAHNSKLETATFAMHCYWEGEAALGGLEGVVSTKSAWLDNKEVVELQFDPQIIGYDQLVEQARSMKCASNVYAHSDDQLKSAKSKVGDLAASAGDFGGSRSAKSSDQKYYLRNSWLRLLPLTEFQAVKINSALIKKQPYKQFLSPRQSKLAAQIQALYSDHSKEFAEMIYPSSELELASYQAKLTQLIAKLSK